MNSPYQPIANEDADHPVQRDLWFYRGRLLPGQSSAALRYRANLQKMQMRAARIAAARRLSQGSQSVSVSSGTWLPLGPAPLASDASGVGSQDYNWVSGRATAVAIDPADLTGGTVYIGGAYGGMWRAQNATTPSPGSVTWTPMTDDQPTLAVGAIALQPGNATGSLSNVVLVGTGEANSSGDSYYGLGILRSTDAGNTWNLISTANGGTLGTLSFNGLAAARMAFSTKSGQTGTVVVAMATSVVGSDDGLITSSTQRGLYTSTDAGATWTFNALTDPGGAVNPATSATSVVYNAAAQLFFAAVRYHGFYSSADGLHWTRLTVQPGGAALSTTACPPAYVTTCPIYRGELAVVPGRNEMYAWYVDSNENDKGIWRSTNSGATWTQIPDASITNCGDGAGGCGTSQGVYNLEIAAVPNGATATDLYAGAINLYKCTLLTNTSTSCNQGSWLNLTHVYGCSSIAKVHPDQHDLDFAVVNGKDIMYFANDGGIYRALDGYLGLSTGTCGQTNQFDSLNQTLGSMTQFVSFSQHPTDPKTILGGTQDNGSPATASATVSTSWLNVNAGDGGYNAINPASASEWFTANIDVSIQRCALGVSCRSANFQTSEVVAPTDLGGDHGAFYTPYILDPQVASSELLVGTCRVWRGPGVGGSFTALSGDFEPNGVPPCTGGEVNLVRSLAAGGGKDSSGFSKVIYAGTDGYGSGTIPAGGHIWATTNAAGGSSTWTDRTSLINPGSFPISGVAIDTADATGNTAYVTIMGFHVSHVWKTTNAGSTWTDFTGTGLPDSPANAVVVDPGTTTSNGMVYVATDVGVFASSTGSASWTEVGPAPSSGQTGYLPNVAVTALRIFNSGGSKRLRASTYGRGIWDFNLILVPDFQFSFSTSALTIFPTQSATFNGTLAAVNGYNSSVALSCTGSAPSTCTPNPTSLTPTTSGSAFSIAATGGVGDYSFNAHGVGSDSNTVTHDFPLTLHVVDFGLGAPSPGSVTVNRPSTSQNITFAVTASGSFSGIVSLSCSGLPSGASCNFSPSASVNPTASNPITVTLTIGTSLSTPPGTSTVTISASTPGAPAPKTQPLSLTVTAIPDFILATSGSSFTTVVNQPVQISGTLTAVNGYSSPVNLSCTGTPPSTCTANPSSVTPTSGGAAFTETVSSASTGTFNFNLTATGTDSSHVTHSVPISFTANTDFSLSNNSGTQTVLSGQAATYQLNFTPLGQSTFTSAVTYSCSGLPQLTTCAFNPPSISAGSGATAVVLDIATVGPNSSQRREGSGRPRPSRGSILLPFTLFAAGLVLTGLGKNRRLATNLCMILSVSAIMLSCGGGPGGSTTPPPPAPVTVAVTPNPANLYTNQTQQFSAAVTGTTVTTVTWQATLGTIDANGLYTAPGSAAGSPDRVIATSTADTTRNGSATVNISPTTAPGTYTITVAATSSGIVHNVPVILTVQ